MTIHSAPRPAAPHRRARGLSIIELVIFMTISSVLLLAIGTAFVASFNSYKESSERGQLLNSVRSFMYKITTDIRACDAAGPYDPVASTATMESTQFVSLLVPGAPTSGLVAAGGTGVLGIQLVKSHPDSIDPAASAANPVTITYWLDSANERILMTRQTGAISPTPTVVCNYVQSLQIYLQPVYVPANPRTGATAGIALSRAAIWVTLANRDANGKRLIADASQFLTLTLTDSAVPRKNFGSQ